MFPAGNSQSEGPGTETAPQGLFATTHWSVVLAAGKMSPAREQALEVLCSTYWYPLYVFLRRLGHSPADAQDLTQGFFAYLLEIELVGKANPKVGLFRSFL